VQGISVSTYQLTVCDLQGRTVFTKEVNNNSTTSQEFTISNSLSKGLYVVVVTSGNEVLGQSKMVVE
jgi:hypothetical protein